jgi:O-antigen/teichoic acid export membrane protein
VTEPGNLTAKIVKGSALLLGLKIVARGLGLVSTLFLAKLLAPADFGILGICFLAISLLETFSETGLQSALIQRKGDIDGYLDSAWVASVLRGFGLGLLLYLSAPLVAAFFETPRAGEVLRALALSPVLAGLSNMAVVVFMKELNFKKLFLYEVTGNLSYFLLALPLAFWLKDVWALAYAILASKALTCLASYLLHPYRPGFRFDIRKAAELFQFGRWLFWTNIVLYFINQGQNAFVGKVLGATALGFYAIAYKISYLPVTEITSVFSKIMFPTYSKLQDDKVRSRDIYCKTLHVLAWVSIPISGIIFFFSHDFIRLFLGPKWLPAVAVIQVYAFSGFLVSIGASAGPFLHGTGKPRIVTKILMLRLTVTGLFIYPFTVQWGMPGTALSILLSTLVVEPLEVYVVARFTGNSLLELAKGVAVPFGITAVVLGMTRFVQTFTGEIEGRWVFLGFVVLVVVLYLGVCFIYDRFFKLPALRMFMTIASCFLPAGFGASRTEQAVTQPVERCL